MDEKLAQHDELLLELRNGKQILTATQHGIQDQESDQHLLLRNLHLSDSALKCMNIERLITYVLGMVKDDPQEVDVEVTADLNADIPEALCLSALLRNCNGVNTILVAGWVKKRVLSILVNSNSTHNFINELTMVETGYQFCYVQPIKVTIVDGNYVYCNFKCPQFTWKMGSKTFVEDL
ncbi:hypothetical protein H5410_061067 [Solanum commersonii]|uniref:Uncharacterized protein n=1 Tax=Solanum commersonii TaxID=4109 RepID=A0A9J5W6R0_SOLCO|nr:hypothetical protein H5410_061067 [Solanum commersonii]